MRKKRKRKYYTVSFKLSSRQLKSLENYCVVRKTTPTKLIKKKIRDYIEMFAKEVPEKYHVTHNQLDLFNKENESLSLFD